MRLLAEKGHRWPLRAPTGTGLPLTRTGRASLGSPPWPSMSLQSCLEVYPLCCLELPAALIHWVKGKLGPVSLLPGLQTPQAQPATSRWLSFSDSLWAYFSGTSGVSLEITGTGKLSFTWFVLSLTVPQAHSLTESQVPLPLLSTPARLTSFSCKGTLHPSARPTSLALLLGLPWPWVGVGGTVLLPSPQMLFLEQNSSREAALQMAGPSACSADPGHFLFKENGVS